MIHDQCEQEWISFNGFRFPFLPKLNYFKDGKDAANSILFIMDPDEAFQISFEGGMKCIDLLLKERKVSGYTYSEYRVGNKYLHQGRTEFHNPSDLRGIAYFHMEVPDMNGKIYICPGQMSVALNYSWSDGVEPTLRELLNGLMICKMDVQTEKCGIT